MGSCHFSPLLRVYPQLARYHCEEIPEADLQFTSWDVGGGSPHFWGGGDVQSPAWVCYVVSRAHHDFLGSGFASSVQHHAPPVCVLQVVGASSKTTCFEAQPYFAWRGGFRSAQMTADPGSWVQSDLKKPHCSFLTVHSHSHAVCSRP